MSIEDIKATHEGNNNYNIPKSIEEARKGAKEDLHKIIEGLKQKGKETMETFNLIIKNNRETMNQGNKKAGELTDIYEKIVEKMIEEAQ